MSTQQKMVVDQNINIRVTKTMKRDLERAAQRLSEKIGFKVTPGEYVRKQLELALYGGRKAG